MTSSEAVRSTREREEERDKHTSKVLRENHNRAAVDLAAADNDAVSRRVRRVHAKVGAAVRHQRVHLPARKCEIDKIIKERVSNE